MIISWIGRCADRVAGGQWMKGLEESVSISPFVFLGKGECGGLYGNRNKSESGNESGYRWHV
jgi:hypothetical protein